MAAACVDIRVGEDIIRDVGADVRVIVVPDSLGRQGANLADETPIEDAIGVWVALHRLLSAPPFPLCEPRHTARRGRVVVGALPSTGGGISVPNVVVELVAALLVVGVLIAKCDRCACGECTFGIIHGGNVGVRMCDGCGGSGAHSERGEREEGREELHGCVSERA